MYDAMREMLKEDVGFEDITSNAVVDPYKIVTVFILSGDVGIFAGGSIVSKLFEENDVEVKVSMMDGSQIGYNDVLMSVRGYARDVFRIERTVLNLLMRMSGVATLTNHYCQLVKDYNVIVAGTRKTMPGLSKFDNHALRVGGADTHRLRLDDMVLIKDNHIKTCESPVEALKKAQDYVSFSKKIEIEVETIEDAVECVLNAADIVMLDNMEPDEVKEVIDRLNDSDIRYDSLIEVSGGITEDNIVEYAKTGVDIISIGALTHSARSLDFHMEVISQS